MKAKFKCASVTQLESGGEHSKLYPVKGNDPEDAPYSTYTPNGNLELTITNPTLRGFFKPGKSYVLDIEEVIPETIPTPAATTEASTTNPITVTSQS